jgi:hypothetical protein
MRRIGHCATMAMGLLALKGLRPNLCAKCHSRETNRKSGPRFPIAARPRFKSPFQVFRQILATAIGLPCPYCGHPMQHPEKGRAGPAAIISGRTPWRGVGYSSLFSFRFPQCVSLRDESNSRSTCRLSARSMPMRACIRKSRPSAPFAAGAARHLRRYPVRCGSGPPALIGRTNSRDSPHSAPDVRVSLVG